MTMFKTWCWAKFRTWRAVFALVSALLSSSVLKGSANHLTLLGVRLFSSRWNQLQKVPINFWIGVCLICHTDTLKRLFDDFHFVINEAHFSREIACCIVWRRLTLLPLWNELQLLLSIYKLYAHSHSCQLRHHQSPPPIYLL